MSVFIQFLVDHLAFVIIVGIVIAGIIGIGTALIICTVRDKRKTGRKLEPQTKTGKTE